MGSGDLSASGAGSGRCLVVQSGHMEVAVGGRQLWTALREGEQRLQSEAAPSTDLSHQLTSLSEEVPHLPSSGANG